MNIQDLLSQFHANIPAGHSAKCFSPWERFWKSSRECGQKYLSYSNRTLSALSPKGGYRSDRARARAPIPSISFSLHDQVELPSCSPTNPAGKLGMVWAPLSIQFSPSWRSRCQESRPTDQPDVLSFLASHAKERWWKSLTERGVERKGEEERRKKKCALFARTDFLELLMARDSGENASLSARVIFHFPPWRRINI